MSDGGATMPLLFIYNIRKQMIDKNTVTAIAEEWLADKDYFLVDASVTSDNKIVVEIDHAEGVWIDDCVQLSRFIEARLDREKEDFELEVGSAGIGQPFKVLRQYQNHVGKEVEVLTADGKKLSGTLKAVDDNGFTLTVSQKVRLEGMKRPKIVEQDLDLKYENVKYTKYIISFK